jgi:DNA-binding transcriptional MerR regulator
MDKRLQHPIRAVAHRTGLPPHIIRVWEKRYKAVVPHRSETNRRSYSEDDIERLKALKLLTDRGHRISQIAPLPLVELKELLALMGEEETENLAESFSPVSVENLLRDSLQAIENLDPVGLDLYLGQATVAMSPLGTVDQLLMPLIRQVREQCRKGKLRVLHLQFARAIISSYLMNSAKSYEVPLGAPLLAVATLSGQQQDVESLFIMIAAAASGWRAVFFGTKLPAEEVAAGVHRLSTKVLALCLINPKADPTFHPDLVRLKRLLPPDTRILVIGKGAEISAGPLGAMGAVSLPTLSAFQEYLETINGSSQESA